MKDNIPKEIADRLEFKVVNGDHPRNASVKLLHEPRPCEDCGIDVVDRRTETRLQRAFIPTNPTRTSVPLHWASTCKNCKMRKNLDTGKFDIPFHQYNAYLKDRKKQMDK